MTTQALPETSTVALTDDEAVALAVGAGVPWPFSLPTVDDTAEALAAAAGRGLRSLRVRDLVRETDEGIQTHADLMSAMAPVLAGKLVGAVSITDSEANAKADTFAFAYYLDAQVGLLETLSSDGVHTFQSCDPATWTTIARSMSDIAFRGAISEVSPRAREIDGVTVSAPGADGEARAVVVTRDSARAGTSRDGKVILQDAAPLDSLLTELGLGEQEA